MGIAIPEGGGGEFGRYYVGRRQACSTSSMDESFEEPNPQLRHRCARDFPHDRRLLCYGYSNCRTRSASAQRMASKGLVRSNTKETSAF